MLDNNTPRSFAPPGVAPLRLTGGVIVTQRYYVAPSGRAMLSLHIVIIAFANYYLSYFLFMQFIYFY